MPLPCRAITKTASEAAWRMANRIKGNAVMVRGGQKRVSAPWLVLKILASGTS